MKRICYISRFARPLPPSDLAVLAASSSRRNEARDITGVLMSSGDLFYQVIEGPDDAVAEVFESIRHDERHTDITILQEEDGITERRFPRWSMARLSIDEQSRRRMAPLRAILEALVESQRRVESLSRVLQEAMWIELED